MGGAVVKRGGVSHRAAQTWQRYHNAGVIYRRLRWPQPWGQTRTQEFRTVLYDLPRFVTTEAEFIIHLASNEGVNAPYAPAPLGTRLPEVLAQLRPDAK